MGRLLQIRAVFPEGGAVIISRFGDYEDIPYVVSVRTEEGELISFRHDHSIIKALGYPRELSSGLDL